MILVEFGDDVLFECLVGVWGVEVDGVVFDVDFVVGVVGCDVVGDVCV